MVWVPVVLEFESGYNPFQTHQLTITLRIIGPSYRGTWTCIAGFWDLQTTSFEIPWFLRWGFIYDKIFSFFWNSRGAPNHQLTISWTSWVFLQFGWQVPTTSSNSQGLVGWYPTPSWWIGLRTSRFFHIREVMKTYIKKNDYKHIGGSQAMILWVQHVYTYTYWIDYG